MAPIYLLAPDKNVFGSALASAPETVVANVVPIHELSQLRGLRNQRVYMYGPANKLPTEQQLAVLTKLQHLEFVDVTIPAQQGLAWWYAAAEQAPISKWNISMGILHLFPEHVKDAWI